MATKKPKLTVKQAKFVKGVAEGKTKTQAAVDAGYGNNPDSARAIANEALHNPSVLNALHMELERQGITLEKIIKPVTNALDSDSIELQLKGHDRVMKIVAPRSEGGTSVNINFNQVAFKDKEEFGL
jgi:phage terminase small subunit